MNALVPIQFNSLEVRVFDKGGDLPWFVAGDVCKCLGMSKPSITFRGLGIEHKAIADIRTQGGIQKGLIVSIEGLFWFLYRSRKSSSKALLRHIIDRFVRGKPIAGTGLLSTPEGISFEAQSMLRTQRHLFVSPSEFAQLLNPTQIGRELGLSGKAVNILLIAARLQVEGTVERHAILPGGENFGRYGFYEFNQDEELRLAKGNNRARVKVRWRPEVIAYLKRFIESREQAVTNESA